MRRLLLCIIGLALIPAAAHARPKTDIIVLKNGDHITCEIKELERGKLTIKTDEMGTIEIEWDAVSRLDAALPFQIELSNGLRHFGKIEIVEDNKFRVSLMDAIVTTEQENVVRITPIEEGFLQRIDISLSVGFSFTKASDVAQLNAAGSAKYRRRRDYTTISFSVNTTQKADDTVVRNNDLNTVYNRFHKVRWLYSGSFGLQRNDELGITLRVIAGASGGLKVLQSNHNMLITKIGLAVNNEFDAEYNQSRSSLEGVLDVNFSLFQYDSPKTDVNTYATFFPSLTESDRYRFDGEIRFRREMITDLFWELRLFLNYDNKPPESASSTNDWGIITSVSWTY